VTQGDGALTLRLSLAGDGDPFWPVPFRASFEVSFGATLAVRLGVQNLSPQAIEFEEALHTYFAVADVRAAAVTGLAGCEFIDRPMRCAASGSRMRIGSDRRDR